MNNRLARKLPLAGICGCLVLAIVGPSLVGAQSLAAQRPPKVGIVLPADVPPDKVTIQYYLYGSFGASGRAASAELVSRSFEILPSVEGKTAYRLKLFAWAPGCQIATFDVAIEVSDVQKSYSCSPQSMVTLVGKIRDTGLLRERPAEISVLYVADWACGFFGLSDCEVPQISLGTAKPDASGRFEIALPDFAADPTSSKPGGADFQIVLRQAETWNPIAFLQPEEQKLRSAAGALKPAPSYPQPVVLVARKN
jgi:hypothetical protein